MQQLKCDVLVIGGGLAGCWAALRAREFADRVILVDIGRVARSGSSAFSGAGILCPDDSDNLDIWHKEIVEKGEYLSDQDWVRLMLEDQPRRLADMGRWGLVFERDNNGQVLRHVGLNHASTRITTIDSLQMMDVLRRQMEAAGVTLIERTMITNLLTSDGNLPTNGSVAGAVGFDVRRGETYAINSGATVVASGSIGSFGGMGEGTAMSYWAGAEIFNMEFARCFDKSGFEEKYMGIHLNTYQRMGMKLINARGERFMPKYLPVQQERGKREELGLAIVCEGMQGNGPIYMDLRHLDEDNMNKLYSLPTTTRILNALKEIGIDFRKQAVKYSVTSGPISTRIGGVRNNIFGETSLPGLYSAGEVSGFPGHGTYSVGGVNLALCCVEGYRAGEHAARFARENGARPAVAGQVRELERKALRPLKAPSGLDGEGLAEEMHSFLSPARVSVFRDAATIRGILQRLDDWRDQAAHLRARGYHDLVKANRMLAYVQCARLIFSANLVREETRANNIRIDFPYKDNVAWLQWIVQSRDDKDKHRLKKQPVPLYRYPVKPKEYARIPVKLPFTEWAANFTAEARRAQRPHPGEVHEG